MVPADIVVLAFEDVDTVPLFLMLSCSRDGHDEVSLSQSSAGLVFSSWLFPQSAHTRQSVVRSHIDFSDVRLVVGVLRYDPGPLMEENHVPVGCEWMWVWWCVGTEWACLGSRYFAGTQDDVNINIGSA